MRVVINIDTFDPNNTVEQVVTDMVSDSITTPEGTETNG